MTEEEDKYLIWLRGQRSHSIFEGNPNAEKHRTNHVLRSGLEMKQGVDTLNKTSHGKHIFLDYIEFFPSPMFDGDQMLRLMKEAVSRSGAREVHAHVENFDGSVSPPGFAAAVLIDESHVSAHCYSDRGLLAIDAFTCGTTDPETIISQLKDALSECCSTLVLMQEKCVERFLLPEV